MSLRNLKMVSVLLWFASMLPSVSLADALINYHGNLYQNQFFQPVVNGYVVAGTFAPGFDASSYFHIYGDESGNVAPNHYSNAVADGAFRPIGSLVTTDPNGFFSGSGSTSEPPGTPIYLFGFRVHPDFGDWQGVLATSSHASFLVPSEMGSTTLNAGQANIFLWGFPGPNGLVLDLLPIPEPNGCMLAAVAAAMLSAFQVRRVRRH